MLTGSGGGGAGRGRTADSPPHREQLAANHSCKVYGMGRDGGHLHVTANKRGPDCTVALRTAGKGGVLAAKAAEHTVAAQG